MRACVRMHVCVCVRACLCKYVSTCVCVRACVRACVHAYTCRIYMESLVLRERTYWTEQSGRMILITIPAMPDDGETRGEDNCLKWMHVCLYMIQASMRRSKVKGNIIVFINHQENSTTCIVLNIKTENQGLWAAISLYSRAYSRVEGC